MSQYSEVFFECRAIEARHRVRMANLQGYFPFTENTFDGGLFKLMGIGGKVGNFN